jgi:putative aldouronate transport system substrate-binding protein
MLKLSTVFTAGSLLAACTPAPASAPAATSAPAAEPTKVPEATKAQESPASAMDEAFKFSMFHYRPNGLANSRWWEPLQKAANVKIELVDGVNRDEYPKLLDLRFASGDMPDTMVIGTDRANKYGPEGGLVNMKPLIDEHAPNIKAFYEKNPLAMKILAAESGGLYTLGGSQPQSPTLVWMIREDLLKKLNLSAPTDKDELLTVLKALKAANPEKKENFIPLTFREANHLRIFNNLFDARPFSGDADKGYTITGIPNGWGGGYSIYAPGFKDMLVYMKQLVDEGLMDEGALTQALTEEAWQENMLQGSAVMTADHFGRSSWFTENGKKLNPEYSMKTMAPLKSISGKQEIFANMPYPGITMGISSAAKDPVSIIKFFDFLFSPEGNAFVRWGVEGESYKVVDGKRELLVSFEEQATLGDTVPHWNLFQTNPTLPAPADNEAFLQFLSEEQKVWIPEFVKKYDLFYVPPAVFNESESAKLSEITTELNPALDNGIIKFVKGQRPIEELNQFVAEMEKLGYKDVIDLYQTSVNRLTKK